jgi:hypothetical protein
MCKGIIDKIYQRLTADKKNKILNQEHPKEGNEKRTDMNSGSEMIT